MPQLISNLNISSKRIGKGHFGEVFLGDDQVHGTVAVKRMVKEPSESGSHWAARKAGLLQEAQHLKQATHPNVVQVFHLVEGDGGDSIYYVMQYCDGGSLQAQYEAGPMNLATLRTKSTQVSNGLQSLHNRGMLHRDIKPGNLLNGGDGVARLGDFGLVTDELIFGYASRPDYMYSDHIAPEVHVGNPTSIKTDIWALGMTIYRLAHGEAWCKESPRPVHLIRAGGYADGLRWLPHVPKQWRSFIRKALRDDPDRRFKTVHEVLEGLGQLPVPTWKCSVKPDTIRWTRKASGRKNVVVLTRHDKNRHEWSAVSEPLGSGRSRTLDGSSGIINAKVAARGLEEFFGKRAG